MAKNLKKEDKFVKKTAKQLLKKGVVNLEELVKEIHNFIAQNSLHKSRDQALAVRILCAICSKINWDR